MKSKREGNTRFRLVLTLGLAVVLPALTLIYVNFKHVKSIQRDKKVEALIHRDFQYLLSIAAKKVNGKAYELTEHARDSFPSEADSSEEKRRKLEVLLSKSPWFAHVAFFDSKQALTLQAQPGRMTEKEVSDYSRNYSAWLALEGHYLVEQMAKKSKPFTWFSGESHGPTGPAYTTTAIFTLPQASKDRPVLGVASFDAKYLKQNFFPQLLDELTAQKFNDDQGQQVAQAFYELTPREVNESADQRLAMMVYPADALKSEPDRPLATTAGWGGGKPEITYKLDDPFRGLALGIARDLIAAHAVPFPHDPERARRGRLVHRFRVRITA